MREQNKHLNENKVSIISGGYYIITDKKEEK